MSSLTTETLKLARQFSDTPTDQIVGLLQEKKFEDPDIEKTINYAAYVILSNRIERIAFAEETIPLPGTLIQPIDLDQVLSRRKIPNPPQPTRLPDVFDALAANTFNWLYGAAVGLNIPPDSSAGMLLEAGTLSGCLTSAELLRMSEAKSGVYASSEIAEGSSALLNSLMSNHFNEFFGVIRPILLLAGVQPVCFDPNKFGLKIHSGKPGLAVTRETALQLYASETPQFDPRSPTVSGGRIGCPFGYGLEGYAPMRQVWKRLLGEIPFINKSNYQGLIPNTSHSSSGPTGN